MSSLEVNIEYIEQQTIYGLWQKSNDKTISKDIKALSKQYHAMVSMPEGKVLPYFVLSRNYNEQSRDLGDTVFYTVSHGTICLQDYFMEQIDSILKSYGYQSLNYGTYGSGVEAAPSNQLVVEMVFETYFRYLRKM